MDLARAVNAEIGRGGHVHPDSDEELQAAPALPVRQKRTREPRRKEVKTILTTILKLKLYIYRQGSLQQKELAHLGVKTVMEMLFMYDFVHGLYQ